MFEVVLFSPRIPPNTGNVIRLCANTGSRLHLVEPMGFVLDEARVRRAGLDYHDMAVVTVHPDLAAAREALADRRWFATTARGGTAPHEVTAAARRRVPVRPGADRAARRHPGRLRAGAPIAPADDSRAIAR